MHSIVCCRIILNLRQAASHRNDSTTVPAGLVFATSPGQQTDQADTMQLEAFGVRSGEEDPSAGPTDGVSNR